MADAGPIGGGGSPGPPHSSVEDSNEEDSDEVNDELDDGLTRLTAQQRVDYLKIMGCQAVDHSK